MSTLRHAIRGTRWSIAAMVMCFAAEAHAQETGWTTWQGLGRGGYVDPAPDELMSGLLASVFVNSNPIVFAFARTGVITAIEERRGFWAPWGWIVAHRGVSPIVAVTTNAAPQPILFYRDVDGAVWFREVTEPGSGLYGATQWTPPTSLGQPADAVPDLIHAMRLSDRRLALCFSDKTSWTIRCRIREAEGAWIPWSSSVRAPEAIGQPMTGRLDAGFRVHFFVASSDGLLELPQGGRSVMGGAWRNVGRLPSGVRIIKPMAALNADGRLEVFSRGSDQALWHIYQQPGTSEWSSWESLGHPPGVTLPFVLATDVVAENNDRRIEVFVVAGDGAVWHIYQTSPNCCWSEWQSLGRPARAATLLTELRVITRRSRLLELFALDQLGQLWTIYQQ